MSITLPKPLAEVMEIYSTKVFNENAVHWVDVTYAEDPHNFYIRHVQYKKYLDDLQREGPTDDELKIGSLVLYNNDHKGFIRGQICEVNKQSYAIFAIDYGFTDKQIPRAKICGLDKYSRTIPPLAVNCKLHSCFVVGNTWDKQAINIMKKMVRNDPSQITVKGGSTSTKLHVLLNDYTYPEDISTILSYLSLSALTNTKNAANDFQLAIVATLNNVDQPTNNFKYEYPTYKIGDTFHVTHASGRDPKCFYVNHIKDVTTLNNLLVEFGYKGKFCDELNAEQMKVNTPVLAITNYSPLKYQRGIIREIIDSDTCQVQLVDVGDILELPLHQLKYMQEYFLQPAPMAIYCSIQEPIDENSRRLLISGNQYTLTIKAVGFKLEKPYIVTVSQNLNTAIK